MQFKNALIEVKRASTHLANAAAQLKNQNLADIIKSGVAKIQQAIEHPDVDAVSEEHADAAHEAMMQEGQPTAFDPNAKQSAAFPGTDAKPQGSASDGQTG